MPKLEGKVGIVTGAARGMGKAHALTLAREGADVAVVDIGRDQPVGAVPVATEDELTGVVQEIEALGQRAIAVRCDVSNADEVEEMVKRVVDEFGKIDILVNNAGILTFTPFMELTEEEWDRVISVNLKGQFLCCKHVLPHMIAQKAGKIVNIGSIEGREGAAGRAHYCCSKAGVHMLTDVLSKEVAEHNINVNCVAPGGIAGTILLESALQRWAAESGVTVEELRKASAQGQTTLGQEVTPEDVANAMMFLVSEESRNITGYVIYVDGGHKL